MSDSLGQCTDNPVWDSLLRGETKLAVLDGGTGEELIRRGMPDDRKTWSAFAVVNEPYHDTLLGVHRSFLESGAQFVTSNSYGLTPGVGFTQDEIAQYCAIAARLARQAANDFSSQHEPSRFSPVVLGSLGPLLESYRADKILDHDNGVVYYTTMVKAMIPFVDAFLGETLSCVEEATQIIDAVKQASPSSSCLISFTVQPNGNLRSGESASIAVLKVLDYASKYGVQCTLAFRFMSNPDFLDLPFFSRCLVRGILFNCSEPEAISLALHAVNNDQNVKSQMQSKGVLLGAYANRLTPVASDWSLEESDGPQPHRHDLNPEQYYENFVSVWIRDFGVQLVGGCCGTLK
jgi:S-methylmethionine-dependent homocysteine/selenocysteine methylase